MSEHYQPKHRRGEWSPIRELNSPKVTPRHAADRLLDRLGATGFDVGELLRGSLVDNPYLGSRR